MVLVSLAQNPNIFNDLNVVIELVTAAEELNIIRKIVPKLMLSPHITPEAKEFLSEEGYYEYEFF